MDQPSDPKDIKSSTKLWSGVPKMNQLDDKFQCMIHQMRNDTDWKDLKRSFVRAPQIVKQKFKGNESGPVDEEFEQMHKTFLGIDANLHTLETELLSTVYNSKQFLDHTIGICEAMSLVFNPNLDSTSTKIPNQQPPQPPAHDVSTLFNVTTKFTVKLREIQKESIPTLELILTKVRHPVSMILGITKNIKKNIKEREFAVLDMSKYNSRVKGLKEKDSTSLTLKQEQNLLRYEKDIDLCSIKYNQINTTLKRDLPVFFSLVNKTMAQLLLNLYFLHLRVIYESVLLSDVTDDHFKLKSKEAEMPLEEFGTHMSETYRKEMRFTKDKLEELRITKSALELSILAGRVDAVSISEYDLDGQSSVRTEPKYCTAKYTFVAEQHGDLSFQEGDKIRLLDTKTLNGDWWRGELDGKVGIFPRTYVII